MPHFVLFLLVYVESKHFVQAKQQGSYRVEWQCKRLDSGEEFPAEVLLTSMILDNEQVLQIVVRDITQRKQVENRVLAVNHQDE
jgi:PAS domain S-box-containing protein